jgi:hypothetical protein
MFIDLALSSLCLRWFNRLCCASIVRIALVSHLTVFVPEMLPLIPNLFPTIEVAAKVFYETGTAGKRKIDFERCHDSSRQNR